MPEESQIVGRHAKHVTSSTSGEGLIAERALLKATPHPAPIVGETIVPRLAISSMTL